MKVLINLALAVVGSIVAVGLAEALDLPVFGTLLGFLVILGALVSRSRREEALERRIQRIEARLRVLRGEPDAAAAPEPREEPEAPEPLAPRPPEPIAPYRVPAPTPAVRREPPLAHDPARLPELRPRKRASLAAQVDWERWIGVRGTALVAGVAAALGGILLFKYAVDEGWITPPVRVLCGVVAGLLCLAGALVAQRKELRHVPGALAGAGVVTLYASAWASYRLYALVPFAASFGAMAVITALAVAFAARTRSQTVAVLGLVGGFATPLLLDADLGRPMSMFGYLLLLDVGLVWVATRSRWPLLALAGVGATFAWELAWLLLEAEARHLPLALGIFGAFAALFAVAGRGLAGQSGLATRAAGLLLPFLFALHLATWTEATPHLWPTAAFLALLAVGAAFTARAGGLEWLLPAAAGGTAGVAFTWAEGRALDGPAVAELAAVAVAFALLFEGLARLARRGREPEEAPGAGLPVSTETFAPAALLAVCLFAATRPVAAPAFGPWPLAAAFAVLALQLLRGAGSGERAWPAFAGALGLGGGVALWGLSHAQEPELPPVLAYLGLALGVAVLAHVAAALLARRRAPDVAAVLFAAAALTAAPLLVTLPGLGVVAREGVPALAAILALAGCVALGTRTTGSPAWAPAALVACVLLQEPPRRALLLAGDQGAGEGGLALSYLSAAAFALAPLALPRTEAHARSRGVLVRAAALAPLLWFLPVHRLLLAFAEETTAALVPALLGALALAVLAGVRELERDAGVARTGTVWLATAGVFLLALAGPMHVDRYVVPVGAAVAGLALALLWVRLDHPGTKYAALGLFALATASVVSALARSSWLPRGGVPGLDWTAYAVLLPAACLLAGSVVVGKSEVARLRPAERERPFVAGVPPVASAAGVGGLVAVFVWINLVIYDRFGEGAFVAIDFDRHPGRDLTTSIAWVVYALGILGTGILRGKSALRWASLGFLVLALGKVFLYDLGELEGLHRVASLAGLAVSLLVVSVVYQRFVFRREGGDGQRDDSAATGTGRPTGASAGSADQTTL